MKTMHKLESTMCDLERLFVKHDEDANFSLSRSRQMALNVSNRQLSAFAPLFAPPFRVPALAVALGCPLECCGKP